MSSASALKLMLWCLDTLFKESVDWTNNNTSSIGFSYMKKKKSLMEDKRNNEASHLSELQKAHLTGEFVVTL